MVGSPLRIQISRSLKKRLYWIAWTAYRPRIDEDLGSMSHCMSWPLVPIFVASLAYNAKNPRCPYSTLTDVNAALKNAGLASLNIGRNFQAINMALTNLSKTLDSVVYDPRLRFDNLMATH